MALLFLTPHLLPLQVHKPVLRANTPTANWQDPLLTPPAPATHLQQLISSFPAAFNSLHLLALSPAGTTVYATVQQSLPPRKPYATTSNALPLPLDGCFDRRLAQDSFAHCFASETPEPLLCRDARLVDAILPGCVLRFLGVDNVDKNLLAREIVCSERAYKTINRAQAALYALHVNQVQLVAGSVEEAPSTTEGVVLRGNIFVKKMGMFGDVKRIQVSPVYATALANAAGVLCYVRRDMFDMCCVKLNDMLSVYTSGGKTRATERGCYSIPRDEDVERKNFVTRCETWELKADDVLALSDEELRVMLKSSGIGVTRLESREVLLAKIVGIMDEVERREIGIAMAANGGNYGMAGKLQKERSERGRLLTELKKAEREGRWGEVVTLAERAKWIEGGIMDVTAEPGSYQRDLDRDDWYRPNR